MGKYRQAWDCDSYIQSPSYPKQSLPGRWWARSDATYERQAVKTALLFGISLNYQMHGHYMPHINNLLLLQHGHPYSFDCHAKWLPYPCTDAPSYERFLSVVVVHDETNNKRQRRRRDEVDGVIDVVFFLVSLSASILDRSVVVVDDGINKTDLSSDPRNWRFAVL